MQLLASMKQIRIACLFLILASVSACHKAPAPNRPTAIHTSLCELYANPRAYHGKLVTFTATITRLRNGKYLYPGSNKDCFYSLVRFEGNNIENPTLTELESLSLSSPGRKEFDLEVTGTFDANYSEDFEVFRYRFIPTEVKPMSPIRTGKPLAAA